VKESTILSALAINIFSIEGSLFNLKLI